MSSGTNNVDAECGSEELPFIAAKFVRGDDIKLPQDPLLSVTVFATDIAKHLDGNLLIGCNTGAIFRMSNNRDIKKITSYSSPMSSITGGCDGCCVVVANGQCAIFELDHKYKAGNGRTLPRVFTDDDDLGCFQMRMTENFQAFAYKNGQLHIKTAKGACKHSADFRHTINTYRCHIQLVNVNGGTFLYDSGVMSETTHHVTKISMTGDILNVYNNLRFSEAGPIAVTDDGHVFVCFPKETCIQLLTPDLSKGVTILDHTDGIERPTAIYFCSNKKILYVASGQYPIIMTFEVKY